MRNDRLSESPPPKIIIIIIIIIKIIITIMETQRVYRVVDSCGNALPHESHLRFCA